MQMCKSAIIETHPTTNPECDIRENFASNEYMNIFVSKKLHERMSEYICMRNLTRTNV